MADPPAVKDSILQSTKKMLGIGHDDDSFDLDITIHINTAFSTMFQAGVGPILGFQIDDGNNVWSQFTGDRMDIAGVKTYVYLRVRLLFDPPTSSFALDAVQKQIDELLWRLNVAADFTIVPLENLEIP